MDPPITEARSRLMSRIRRANTRPERIVRSLLHRLGYRFRTQLRGIPGRPDVAFPGRRKGILVHGCFWHQHTGCRHARIPATRQAFWAAKFDRNRERDQRLLVAAEALGWEMLVVWECETRDAAALEARLTAFVGATRVGGSPTRAGSFPLPPSPPTLLGAGSGGESPGR